MKIQKNEGERGGAYFIPKVLQALGIRSREEGDALLSARSAPGLGDSIKRRMRRTALRSKCSRPWGFDQEKKETHCPPLQVLQTSGIRSRERLKARRRSPNLHAKGKSTPGPRATPATRLPFSLQLSAPSFPSLSVPSFPFLSSLPFLTPIANSACKLGPSSARSTSQKSSGTLGSALLIYSANSAAQVSV